VVAGLQKVRRLVVVPALARCSRREATKFAEVPAQT
jgi:hypothetical protein